MGSLWFSEAQAVAGHKSRVEEYRPLALAIARDYYFPGADADDVRQEAMIALALADRGYDRTRGSFHAFAKAVIHRRLTSALQVATRKKHRVLSEAVELETVEQACWALDPAAIVEGREEALELLRRVREDLNPLQRHCLVASLNGLSHEEIALEVGGSETFTSHGSKRYPRVYNALYEARRKLAA